MTAPTDSQIDQEQPSELTSPAQVHEFLRVLFGLLAEPERITQATEKLVEAEENCPPRP